MLRLTSLRTGLRVGLRVGLRPSCLSKTQPSLLKFPRSYSLTSSYRPPTTSSNILNLTRNSIIIIQKGQLQNYSSYKIRNPLGKRLLKLSASFSRGYLIVYFSTLIIGGLFYNIVSYYLDLYEKPARDWPFAAKIWFRVGIAYTEWSLGTRTGIKCLQTAVDILERPLLDKTTGQVDISNKSEDWLNKYSAVLIRLGLLQNHSRIIEPKIVASNIIKGLQVGYGPDALKSKASIYLARLELTTGNLKMAETHLLNAVSYGLRDSTGNDSKYPITDIYTNKNSVNKADKSIAILPEDFNPTRETIDAIIETGKFYARHDDIATPLSIFLSLLRSLQYLEVLKTRVNEKKSFLTGEKKFKMGRGDIEPNAEVKREEEPLLKVYIGELLWKMGEREKGIEWLRAAFNEAYKDSYLVIGAAECCKIAANTLSKMYENFDGEEAAEEAKNWKLLASDIGIPVLDSGVNSLKSMLFHGSRDS